MRQAVNDPLPGYRFWSWAMGRSEPARILRFAAIGGVSTLIYAVLTLALSALHGFGRPAAIASVAGYGAGAVFSYCGHRFVTFMSDGSIGFEIVRFACATAIGFLLSVGLAMILTDVAGLPPLVPVAIASILVPVLNFIILRKFVFVAAR
ncbi:GtrA family protein [Mesorhizobium sp. M0179]|uniref:GtrA family protein n=1 Tax=unclassified Mesorhizobium TaxID=325217 RepID=UPI00067EC624|nr:MULTISPECIES: GtrA family protein [unclassified Mesorhizobium]WJI72268.1 GtrA family protein [Mesorhizobium sp. C399B]